MTWSERQQALLRGMGLKVWAPPPAAELLLDTPPAPAPAPALPPAEVIERPAPVAQVQAAPSASSPVARPATPAPVALPRSDSPVANMDWPALREAVAGCIACSLCESRTQTVFGVGHPNAHWMIVGEAPGEQEDRQGEPFVGAAGQLLDQMLKAVGLTRQDGEAAQQVFIANTLKCRPPRNRNPLPEELAQCSPFLSRQIALVQPKLILAMGRFAIQQLLGTDESVGKLRGKVHQHAGVPVIVTYHPAYLLRQLTEKAKTWEDLCLAMSVYRRQLTSTQAGT
ncbi:uracil-DNA glycosylase [Ideonella azotifigens]|uniref:Type-4 uracil-DNA glycosylase n=1 Tax=Ideonella azotifigens TaxID=513160 RepID=A0ABN1K9K2_9BURK|nr:uracil-DNA glycosylase [Ideonella azotifigens]MCD2339049.1 uracil-DNA glycosylase [Ideonella azotifigens]